MVGGEAAEPRRVWLRGLGTPFTLALAAVVLLGFGLRVWGALHPESDPGPDADAYASLARWLFLNHSYGAPGQANTSDWSAGAPLLFSAVYRLTGGVNPEAARLLVALLGAGTVLGTFLLGRRLGGRWVGLVAALLVATYPTYIENNEQLLSEPVAAFFLVAGLVALVWATDPARKRWWTLARSAVAGLAFGALVLTRPEYEAIVAILLVLAAWRVWRAAGWRPAVAGAALLVICAAVVVTPWMYRNHRMIGHWAISTGGGKALFIGTYLPGEGRQFPVKRALMRRYGIGRHLTDRQADGYPMAPLLNRVAKKYPHIRRDKALGKIARANMIRYLEHQPGAYLRMSATKFWHVFRRGSGPYMRDPPAIYYHRGLLIACVVGLVLALWRRRTRWLGLLYAVPVLSVAAIGMALLAVPRRQVPIIPLISIFAATALVTVVQLLARRVGAPARGTPPRLAEEPQRAPAPSR
jgi:4-amino-4-deoxy-L-arabinose transferase-like glycosyltransferase